MRCILHRTPRALRVTPASPAGQYDLAVYLGEDKIRPPASDTNYGMAKLCLDFAAAAPPTVTVPLSAGAPVAAVCTLPAGVAMSTSNSAPWVGLFKHGTTELVAKDTWYHCKATSQQLARLATTGVVTFMWAAPYLPKSPGTYTALLVPNGDNKAEAPLGVAVTVEFVAAPEEGGAEQKHG